MEKVKINIDKINIDEQRYCVFCGKELLMTIVGAEHVKLGIDQDCSELPYDEKTGKRRYAIRYKCPNYRWYNLFSDHDNYYVLLSDEEAERIIRK